MKIRTKKILLLLLFVILASAIALGMILFDGIEYKIYKRHTFDEYAFSISYPQIYSPISQTITNNDVISNNISSILVENENPEATAITFVEEIVKVKSADSGITLLIEGIKKDKTSKSIEEICKDYITMFKVYNSNEVVLESDFEEVEIGGVKAGKTTIYINGKTEDVFPGMISYLVPLEDREITIVFVGTKTLITKADKEINKIINSVKFEMLDNNVSGEVEKK